MLDLSGTLLQGPLPTHISPGLKALTITLLSAINLSKHLCKLIPVEHLGLDGQLPLELEPSEFVQVGGGALPAH